MARTRNLEVVTTPWFIRLGLYILVAAVGLVLTVLGYAVPEDVDTWLGQLGPIAAMIGGLAAAFNVTKDDKVTAPDATRPTPVPAPSTGNVTLDQLREMIAQNRR